MNQNWWSWNARERSPGHYRRSQRQFPNPFARKTIGAEEVERRLRDEADFVREAPSPILRQRTLQAIHHSPRRRYHRSTFITPVRPAFWSALAAMIVVAGAVHFSQQSVEPPSVGPEYTYSMAELTASRSGGLSIVGQAEAQAEHRLQAEFNAMATETQRAARALLERMPFAPEPAFDDRP